MTFFITKIITFFRVCQDKLEYEGRPGTRKSWERIPVSQPLLQTGGILRKYQMDGYKWMYTLWEIGLSKTIQVNSLFCHMQV